MAQVVPIRPLQPRYWVPMGNEKITRLPLPYKLDRVHLNCPREGLHIDKMDISMLPHLWPWIKEGLLYIKHKNGQLVQWIPEHIRMEIQKGFANVGACECFIGHDADDDSIRGFLVAYPLNDPFINLALTWHVWMATLSWNVLDKVLPEFEHLARERGFTRWQWGSSRASWERRAARFGATVVERTIGKDL